MLQNIIPINVDKIARKKDYASLGPSEVLMYSKFLTIQGEGPFAGKRALFLRLAGCNFGDKKVHCTWCDTKFFLDSGKPTHFDVVLNHLNDGNCNLLVVTGGEPLMQPNIERMVRFLLVQRPELHIQFETNGTQHAAMGRLLEFAPRVTVICSPKASAKSGYASIAPIAHRLTKLFPNNFFYKFVVTSDSYDVHYNLPDWAYSIAEQVYVSPMTLYLRNVGEHEIASAWDRTLVNHEATQANYKYAARLAMQHGFTVSVQMHTWLDLE